MDFRRMATIVASGRIVPRWAVSPGDNLSELGMHADYGPDAMMMQTHTDLGPDDVESFSDRAPQGGGSGSCMHAKALPGAEVCPDCGGELQMLSGV